MLSQERDTLSAGLHAAAALLYPFRWQHIYLPYLPHSLKVSGGSFVLARYHFILPCSTVCTELTNEVLSKDDESQSLT